MKARCRQSLFQMILWPFAWGSLRSDNGSKIRRISERTSVQKRTIDLIHSVTHYFNKFKYKFRNEIFLRKFAKS